METIDLVGASTYIVGETIVTELFFGGQSLEEMKSQAQASADSKGHEEDQYRPSNGARVPSGQRSQQAPTYVDEYNGVCNDPRNGVRAGRLTNFIEIFDRGQTTYNGSGATVWDVKYNSASVLENGYQTRETRVKQRQDSYFSQDIIDYGQLLLLQDQL